MASRALATADEAVATPVSTVMVQNLPIRATTHEFVRHLDDLGFKGQYDFVHLPRDPRTRQQKGFGFVNLVDEQTAARLMQVITGTQLARSRGTSAKKLTAKPAYRQGCEAQMAALRAASDKAGRAALTGLPWVRGLDGEMTEVHL